MRNIVDMSTEEWNAYKVELRASVQTIAIPADVSPKVAIVILSRIDQIHSMIRVEYAELESAKESTDLIVKETERMGLQGRNEDARRRSAVLAVRERQINGFTLYDLQRENTKRYMFLRSILDVLMSKQSRLITINGLLKLEKDLIVSGSSYNSLENRSGS